jgi:AraC family transcriptional regulator
VNATGDKRVFGVEETHGRALRSGNEIICHSATVGWQSLYAATFREAPLAITEPAIGHPSLIYHLARTTEVSRRIDGERGERALIAPGRFCVTPGDATAYWQHSGNPEILQLYLRDAVYERAVTDMFGGAAATLLPRFAVVDPLLEQLAIAVLNALRDGSVEDRLYVETIAQLIAVHLARVHSTQSRARREAPLERLSPVRIRRLLDYIEQNLGGDLSLEAMAAEVELSPLYLVRAFRSTVGKSPHQYVVGRRVEHARRLLAGTDLPIAEIALAAGFSSQSHLSNWFRRMVGVSPAQYRKGH